MYMRDDAQVMGHLFITFVAVLIQYEVARLINEVNLASSYSPEDVLDVYATMKMLPATRRSGSSCRRASGIWMQSWGGGLPLQHAGRQGQVDGYQEEEGQEAKGFRTLFMNLYPS